VGLKAEECVLEILVAVVLDQAMGDEIAIVSRDPMVISQVVQGMPKSLNSRLDRRGRIVGEIFGVENVAELRQFYEDGLGRVRRVDLLNGIPHCGASL
jgi:hypothetical protein